jgi:hypothetical protein
MKKSRKLRLAKETVRNLNDRGLGAVNGGVTNYPCNSVNSCVWFSCQCGTERCISNEVACISYESDCGTSDN